MWQPPEPAVPPAEQGPSAGSAAPGGGSAAPAQAPPPAAAPPPETPAARPPRRRLLAALLALHAFSALAAVVLLLHARPARGPSPADGKGRLKLLAAKEDVVGWLPIHGVIRQSESGRAWEAGSEQWARKLRALADKSEVKAIVLEINSPGGTVGAVQEVHSAIVRVRREKKKPVVALLGDIAASGGYYLAAGCDKVVAHPGTLVGSIGVIFNLVNAEGLMGKLGLKAEAIKSGKHKDIGSMTRAMTPEERQLLQGLIDDAYGQFLQAVADGRKIPVDALRPNADGRIFTGDQAKAKGLVDEVGDSRDAIALAGKLGGISGTPKVAKDGEPFENLMNLLEFRLSRWLRPAVVLGDLGVGAPGLEYRWLGR